MGTTIAASLPVAGAASLLLGVAALLLGLGILVRQRRAGGRVADQLAALRRHPLLGEIAPEVDPVVRSLSVELNLLLADLRSQVHEAQGRAVDLQALADGPSDAALVATDAEWRVVAFSRGASGLSGWSAEEILHHHVEVLFAAGEWERILPKLARRSLRDVGITETIRLQRRDGETVPARITVESGATEGGAPGTILISARDLTADQQLEQRLRASEERYRRVVEVISDGVFIVKGSRLAYANPGLARLLGEERETLQGRAFKDLIDTHDLLQVLDTMRRAENGEESAGEIACRLSPRDRDPIDVRIAWSATEFQGGRSIFGTVIDVSTRARFERAMQESEARLRATLNSTAEGILVLGGTRGTLSVTMVNGAFCDLLGLVPLETNGLPEPDLTRLLEARCADPQGLRALLDRARSGQEARLQGTEILAPRRALLDLLAGPVRTAAGESLGIIVTARDVTERTEHERHISQNLEELSRAKVDLEAAYRELAEAQKTLAQRNQQLEQVNIGLKSLDEMKSSLLANVSHELHTPLVSIKGYTEMIVKRKLGPLTQEQERGLSVALKNIDRLIEMIDNLLSFSRLETGEAQLTLEDVPLWQLVDEAIEMVGERIKKKGLSITTQYETDNLVVRGDRLKIGQVLTNLLTNAVKFNREGGRITLTARKGSTGFVEVDVADTGIGIPPEERERIFERFYQADSGPGRKYEGTGIGLAIVRDILRLHGCSIRVISEPEQGSVFTFTLPLVRQNAPTENRHPAGRGRSRE